MASMGTRAIIIWMFNNGLGFRYTPNFSPQDDVVREYILSMWQRVLLNICYAEVSKFSLTGH